MVDPVTAKRTDLKVGPYMDAKYRGMISRAALFAAIFLSCVLLAATARADTPSPAPGASTNPSASPTATPVEPTPPADVSTHHTTQLDGRSIPYTATAGTITLRDDENEPTASMFYVAYTQDGVGRSEPPAGDLLL